MRNNCIVMFVWYIGGGVEITYHRDSVAETSLPVFHLAGLKNTWTVSPLTRDLFRGPATYLRTYIQLDSNFVTLRLSSTTLCDNQQRDSVGFGHLCDVSNYRFTGFTRFMC